MTRVLGLVVALLAAGVSLAASGCSSCSSSDDSGDRDAPFVDGDAGIDQDGPLRDGDGGIIEGDAAIGFIQRLDWRGNRGTLLAAGGVTLPVTRIVSLRSDGFVGESDCGDAGICTLTWYDLAGGVLNQREGVAAVTAAPFSPDGTKALFVAGATTWTCDGQDVVAGTLSLLDAATGEASFELGVRTNVLGQTAAFTQDSNWFVSAPLGDTACQVASAEVRSVAEPFDPSPGLGADDFVYAIDERRWFVNQANHLGVVDPAAADSYIDLGDQPSGFDASGGWAHAYTGFGQLAQDVAALSPTNDVGHTALTDDDWFAAGAWGRWVRVCTATKIDGFKDCRVVDTTNEVLPVNFRVTPAAQGEIDAVILGRDGAIVFSGPTDTGAQAIQRIVFATGATEIIRSGSGTLRSLGDGAAALLVQNKVAYLVEWNHVNQLLTNVNGFLTSPRTAGHWPVRQDDIAVFAVSRDAAKFTLVILDLGSRRLVTLTDRLYYAPHLMDPFGNDFCGQPWTVRSSGSVADGLAEDAQYLYFVEQPEGPNDMDVLFVVPIDFSAFPRQLSVVDGNPIACHAPLVSADGRAIGFEQDGLDSTTVVTTIVRIARF